MSDLNSLLRGVILNPKENTPRLAYADALEELPPIRVECPHPRCYKGEQDDCEIGDISCNRWPCDMCNGTGTIVDPTPARRAAHIRWAVQYPENHGVCLCRPAHMKPCDRCAILRSDPLDLMKRIDGETHYVEHRGFVSELRVTADKFLKHHAALIWHPNQIIPAPKCEACGGTAADERGRWKDKHGHDFWIRCRVCKGISHVSRPCPDTAQPIRKVVFTSHTGWPIRAQPGSVLHYFRERMNHPDLQPFLPASESEPDWYTNVEWPEVLFSLHSPRSN